MAKRQITADDGFNVFWAKYPRREAKQDALKAWSQLGLSVEEQAQIDLALDWQIPLWGKDDFKYAPYPATYLRGRRWEDERRSGLDRRGSGLSGAAGGRTGITPGKYAAVARTAHREGEL